MPIKMKHEPGPEGGILYPIYICDWCGERITDAKHAHYYWSRDLADLAFAHWQCAAHLHLGSMTHPKTGARLSQWHMLTDFALYLSRNASVPAFTERARGASMESE